MKIIRDASMKFFVGISANILLHGANYLSSKNFGSLSSMGLPEVAVIFAAPRGSPIIFIEELQNAISALNLRRMDRGLSTIQIECFFIFNDASKEAVEKLETNVAPVLAGIKEHAPDLHIEVRYMNGPFEVMYQEIKEILRLGRYRNVLFNLDQCGHIHVGRGTINDIMRSYSSAEIFYTFMISALLTFLQKADPEVLAKQLAPVGLGTAELSVLEGAMSNNSWLGAAERLVFEAFKNCASYVSPFSINNPGGWRYWLIHFSNSYRARQVYNNTLHQNSSTQAHFGRSGLNMLAYDPSDNDGRLYFFDDLGRDAAKNELLEDIPRLVSESGDLVSVSDFYESIYNATPAHMDDIHAAITDNPDLQVLTQSGGERRKANTIVVGDLIKLKAQTSFFPMFLGPSKPK